MLSLKKIGPGNAWRYYVRGVMVGDGRRPARKPLKAAQEEAGVPPGVWMGRGLPALGLTPGAVVTELLFGEGRHPDADRIEGELLAAGATPDDARRATVLGRSIADIANPLLALDLVFRPQASITLLWALGDDWIRQAIEEAHEWAIGETMSPYDATPGLSPGPPPAPAGPDHLHRQLAPAPPLAGHHPRRAGTGVDCLRARPGRQPGAERAGPDSAHTARRPRREDRPHDGPGDVDALAGEPRSLRRVHPGVRRTQAAGCGTHGEPGRR
ncbi:relaxase domain-containing protein [Streptomyces sp. NBC_00885]|uniref:relaxase domain-containing protein n=1 Tax=Streptomyces sp. NBC_00885 TaxID=2975857 RepID=UPI003865E9D9